MVIELKPALKALECAVVLSIEYLAPIFIMVYAYSRMIIALTKKVANPVNGPRSAVSKAKKNVLVTTTLIGVMFVLCWTPLEIYFISYQLSNGWNRLLYLVFTGLLTCNMFVNPFIYCFKYERFRKELKQLIFRRCRRHQVGDGEVISIPVATSRITNNPLQSFQSHY